MALTVASCSRRVCESVTRVSFDGRRHARRRDAAGRDSHLQVTLFATDICVLLHVNASVLSEASVTAFVTYALVALS